MKDTPSKPHKVSAKRQAILAQAFEQLRKSRAKIDPDILNKIRSIVSSSSEIMKKLGISEPPKVDNDMPLSQKSPVIEVREPVNVKATPKNPVDKQGYETVDQAKNMEIMAKLMQLKPDGRNDIKSVIDKAGK